MTANTRLLLIAISIMVSAVYAVLVTEDQRLASTIASMYVAVLLTGLVLVNFWKRP